MSLKLYKVINKLTRILEFFLISVVVSAYLLSFYTAFYSRFKFLSLYFLSVSLYYFLCLLTKSPGVVLDFGDAEVKGICKKCDRIVGTRTVHCEICNKCYHKRDHHCVLTGKCIASNNVKDLYFSCLFVLLYCSCMTYTGMCDVLFMYKFVGILLFGFLGWMTVLIGCDKTSSEFIETKGSYLKDFNTQNLRLLLDDGLVYVLLPYLRNKT